MSGLSDSGTGGSGSGGSAAGTSGNVSCRWRTQVDDHVIALAFAPISPIESAEPVRLAVAEVSGPVRLYAADTGDLIELTSGHGLGTCALSWRPDGSLLATAGQDGKVRLWDGHRASPQGELPGPGSWVEHLAWSPSGRYLAAAAGRKLVLWDIADTRTPGGHPAGSDPPNPKAAQPSPDEPVPSLLVQDYPPHGHTVAGITWVSGTQDVLLSVCHNAWRFWTPDSAEPLGELAFSTTPVSLCSSRRGSWIATGNQNGTIDLVNRQRDELIPPISGYPTKVQAVSFSSDGHWLASGARLSVVLWDCSQGQLNPDYQQLVAPSKDDEFTTLAFQTNGPLLATGSQSGRVGLWHHALNLQSPQGSGQLGEEVSQLAWSEDDRWLAAGGVTGKLAVFAPDMG